MPPRVTILALALMGAAVAACAGDEHQKWDCVFLHGAGELLDAPDDQEYTAYWGKMNELAMQCATFTYNHRDTTHRAFDDPYLLDSYCETALLPPVSQRNATAEADDGQLVGLRGDRVIRNKLLFTHSMANTILSKAIHEGVCTIDRNTTAWYMSQGPMQGTKAAETIANICSGITVLDKPVRWIAAAENYCDGRNVSAAYWSLRPGYPAYNDALLDVPRQFADGAMCGTSPYGETSMYSAALEAVAYVVEYGEDNDGLVPLSSCDAWFRSEQPTASFLDPTANFYTPKANHADGTCRVGDGWFAKPCTWYATKMGKPDGAVEPLGRKIVLPGRHANAMAPRAAAAAW